MLKNEIKEPELTGDIKIMKISDLSFDIKNYQRKTSEMKIKKLIQDFDWKAFGFVMVNIRDSKNWVIDGQHRIVAATRKGYKEVPCMVYKDLTLADEARLFVSCQINRCSVRGFEKYQAALVAGDEATIDIHDLLKKHGLKSGNGRSNSYSRKRGYINSLGAIYSIYEKKGKAELDRLLYLIVSAWRYDDGTFDPDALTSTIIDGLQAFINKAHDKINEKKFIEKFKKVSAGKIISMSKKNQVVYGKGKASNTARAILEEYNFRNAHKLDITF
jgi:hypothetical protein